MHHADGWQPSSCKAVHPAPVDPRALAAALQRRMPVPGHLGAESGYRRTVAGDGVVGAVASYHAAQPPSLLRDGLTPAVFELVFDLS